MAVFPSSVLSGRAGLKGILSPFLTRFTTSEKIRLNLTLVVRVNKNVNAYIILQMFGQI